MHPFTSWEQSAQLGEQPFSCEAICYTQEIAFHPTVYWILFVLRKNILKNITLLSYWTGNRQHSTHQSICATKFNMSRSVHYIKMLVCCTPFAVFPYNTKNFSMSLFWQHNMHTVHFYKQVLTTINKCAFIAQNYSTTRTIPLNLTVHFCKQVLTTINKCAFIAQNYSTTRTIPLNLTWQYYKLISNTWDMVFHISCNTPRLNNDAVKCCSSSSP
jgi:hypothetical protein